MKQAEEDKKVSDKVMVGKRKPGQQSGPKAKKAKGGGPQLQQQQVWVGPQQRHPFGQNHFANQGGYRGRFPNPGYNPRFNNNQGFRFRGPRPQGPPRQQSGFQKRGGK